MKHHIALIVILSSLGAANLGIRGAKDHIAVQNPIKSELDLPATVGIYRQVGPDLPVSENVRRVLPKSTILMRDYKSSSSPPITLTIVHTGYSRDDLHFPESCLVGQGWEVSKRESAMVGFSFRGIRLVLDKGARQQAVLYWYKTGDHFTDQAWKNSLFWAERQMKFEPPISSIIKLHVNFGPGGESKAFQLLDDLAVALAPVLRERLD